jgi:hypothetical protein
MTRERAMRIAKIKLYYGEYVRKQRVDCMSNEQLFRICDKINYRISIGELPDVATMKARRTPQIVKDHLTIKKVEIRLENGEKQIKKENGEWEVIEHDYDED